MQIPRKSKDQKRIAITHEQVAMVVEAFDEQSQPLIPTLAYCGLRFGEAAALRRSAIDLERGQLRISQSVTEVAGRLSWGPPKNDQARDVDMPPFLNSLLAGHLDGPVGPDDEALVFTSPKDDAEVSQLPQPLGPGVSEGLRCGSAIGGPHPA